MAPHRKEIPLVATREELENLVQAVERSPWVAIDTEFIRETSFFPDLQIIQVADHEQAWLIDVQAFRKLAAAKGAQQKSEYLKARSALAEEMAPLIRLLDNTSVVKVFHAAFGDQESLYTAIGAVAKNSFDTAVAASLCGYGDGVGLAALLQKVLDIKLKKGHARTNWAARPLPEQLKEYAIQDVDCLVELARRLEEELKDLNRLEWCFELSSKWEDATLYDADPDLLAVNLFRSGRIGPESYGILHALVRWREARTRELNVPRKWLADDSVIMDLARVRPRDMEHLKSFRGLNKGELNRHGKTILELIEQGSKDKTIKLPQREPRLRPPSTDESRSMDLMKAYVALLADEHRIAVKNLLSSGQMLPVLRTEATTVDQMVEQQLMSRGAARLIGEEILEFMRGKRAISLVDRKVHVVKL